MCRTYLIHQSKYFMINLFFAFTKIHGILLPGQVFILIYTVLPFIQPVVFPIDFASLNTFI